MCGENRRRKTVIRGCVLVACLLLAGLAIYGADPSKAQDAIQNGPSAQEATATESDATAGNENGQAAATRYLGLCESLDDPQLSELCEEWRIAVREPQTVLATVETILLTITIFFTAWATLAASRAAKAARDSVTVAQETAQRQLRAYVHIHEALVLWTGDGPVAHLLIKNSGQTPAYNVVFAAATAIGIDVEFDAAPTEGERARSVIGPGGEVLKQTAPLFFPAVDDPTSPVSRARFYAWGSVFYDDAFGVSRYCHFRYVMTQRMTGDTFYLGACECGNDAT